MPVVYETDLDTVWIKDSCHKYEVILTSFKKDFETLEVNLKQEHGWLEEKIQIVHLLNQRTIDFFIWLSALLL